MSKLDKDFFIRLFEKELIDEESCFRETVQSYNETKTLEDMNKILSNASEMQFLKNLLKMLKE